MLSVVEAVVGAVIVILTLSDAFETIVLPRTQQRRYRLTRLIYRGSWWLWASLSEMRISRSRREALLFFYGPTLIILLIVMWAIALIAGFGLILHAVNNPQAHGESLGTSLYLSGSTFFTLGLGDVVPHTSAARVFAIIEAGTGFGFLAMVISYLPIFYQAFSRREVAISSLDAHAGSPATAIELIRRNDDRVAEDVLREWENWAGQLLESHLSYPILALFRSQHEHQSWLGALTVILDTCALSMTGLRDMSDHQARFTFAIARHALIDLAQVFFADPREPDPPRLSGRRLRRARAPAAVLRLPVLRPGNCRGQSRGAAAAVRAHRLLPVAPLATRPAALDPRPGRAGRLGDHTLGHDAHLRTGLPCGPRPGGRIAPGPDMRSLLRMDASHA